jgi:TATA-box binding protein (TBP) (component of TFIID and TFIIIB)
MQTPVCRNISLAVNLKISVDFTLREMQPFLPDAYLNRQPSFLRFTIAGNSVALLFRTGSIVITGIPSPDRQSDVVDRCLRLLSSGFKDCFANFDGLVVQHVRVKTILATSRLYDVRICPYYLRRHAPFLVRWEPEINNAIIIVIDAVTVKLFPGTCSVVIFGKDFDHMVCVFHQIAKFIHIHNRL